MIDTKHLDQVNELARMVCIFKDCTESSCIAKGCGAVWTAEQILKAGWVKQKTCTKGLYLGHNYYCSSCGQLTSIYNYCAYCGAKVKEN
jgi:hypothetical protein